MAGIYLHIPYCRQACHYCNFHFSTQLDTQTALLAAMVKEIQLRRDYLGQTPIRTLYMGGGTPSLLSKAQLEQLLEGLLGVFSLSAVEEFTLEVNPEDLSGEKMQAWHKAGVTRLHVGVQSFYDPHLREMNRSHTAEEARKGIDLARDMGFFSLGIDLIYGIPDASHSVWEKDLAETCSLLPEHVSAYALTLEPQTVLAHRHAQGRFVPASEAFVHRQYEMLCAAMQAAGYVHYEVSSFARPGHEALHNTGYWRGETYLGIGPGAHSFDGTSRQHNIGHNVYYLQALQKDRLPCEREVLSLRDQLHEYLLTRLRTRWGIAPIEMEERFGYAWGNAQKRLWAQLVHAGMGQDKGTRLVLSEKGMLLADSILERMCI